MAKRYSVKNNGGSWHMQFECMAPDDVRNHLKASKHCRWLNVRKMWVCKDKGVVQGAERLLEKQGWKRAPDVVPELAPLRLEVQRNAADHTVSLSFNRAPEQAMVRDMGALQAQPTDDKRVFSAPDDRLVELRRYFAMTDVDMSGDTKAPKVPDSMPVVPQSSGPCATTPTGDMGSATLAIHMPNELVLRFDNGLPTCDKVAEIRGALIALGIQVQPSLQLQEGQHADTSNVPDNADSSSDSD